jgi:hypothetical protein
MGKERRKAGPSTDQLRPLLLDRTQSVFVTAINEIGDLGTQCVQSAKDNSKACVTRRACNVRACRSSGSECGVVAVDMSVMNCPA